MVPQTRVSHHPPRIDSLAINPSPSSEVVARRKLYLGNKKANVQCYRVESIFWGCLHTCCYEERKFRTDICTMIDVHRVGRSLCQRSRVVHHTRVLMPDLIALRTHAFCCWFTLLPPVPPGDQGQRARLKPEIKRVDFPIRLRFGL